ncbi:unannotated protein [freshwater metagenome]|uniref:Unannotated protein n=1 Tax=freshwater metagenome TaxID=449393 RepID=A0A6J7BC86_9ZZZZ
MSICAIRLATSKNASDHVAAAPRCESTGVSKETDTKVATAHMALLRFDKAPGVAPVGAQSRQPHTAATIKTICRAALAKRSA